MSICEGLADQIRRAFEGEAWHGDSLLEILADVDAGMAADHPVNSAHSIWELVLHIAAWDGAVLRRAQGGVVVLPESENFPSVEETGEDEWKKAIANATAKHAELVRVVVVFPDSRLQDRVPGRKEPYYDFFYMFSGIAQHETYHTGQIALLKKMAKAAG
jgi:uncharacterized damage-inducible protein DinB